MIPDSPPPPAPAAVAAAADTPATAAGQFVWRELPTDGGVRRYRLYLPSGYDGKRPYPLVVMLHGCTQDADNIARGTRMNSAADARKIVIAYPEQPASANALRCWNWFEPAHQQRDGGEPALIAGITRQVMKDTNIDSARVYIAGVSAGAAMALTLMYGYPDLYAAVGMHSGIAYGIAASVGEGMKAMGAGANEPGVLGAIAMRVMGERARPIPAIVFHGGADKAVKVVNAGQVVSQLNDANAHAAKQPAPAAGAMPVTRRGETGGGYHYSLVVQGSDAGLIEQWTVDELAHAWSGGSPDGTYTDARGPDATAEMLRFFLEHPRR
ncbi:MAG: PHB depolymerase family esterase [Gemmatimonadaceae bacterium]